MNPLALAFFPARPQLASEGAARRMATIPNLFPELSDRIGCWGEDPGRGPPPTPSACRPSPAPSKRQTLLLHLLPSQTPFPPSRLGARLLLSLPSVWLTARLFGLCHHQANLPKSRFGQSSNPARKPLLSLLYPVLQLSVMDASSLSQLNSNLPSGHCLPPLAPVGLSAVAQTGPLAHAYHCAFAHSIPVSGPSHSFCPPEMVHASCPS